MRKYTVSLEKYLDKQKTLEKCQVLELAIQLVDILADVHQAGYTFNDLKPDNIMLNNDYDGKLRVTLVDFGFAKRYIDNEGKIFD